jgi:hypothetical protein
VQPFTLDIKEFPSMKALRLAAALVMALTLVVIAGPLSSFAANTYSTGFQVQNLSSSVANVTIAFYPQNNGTPSASVSTTIQPKSSALYATLPSSVTAGFTGGAVISSDQNVASLVNVIANGNFNYGDSYTGVTAGANSVTIPLLFKASFGFNTFFNVQNTGSAAASVSITYSGGGLGSPLTQGPFTIQPGSSTQFDQSANASLPAGFNGSAVVTSNQPVAAAVVEAGPTTLLAYNGFTSTSTAPVFPLVNANNSGFITGISLQNAGTSATNVTVSYTPSAAGAACTETQTIQPKGTAFFALNAFASSVAGENCANGAKFVGSGRVTANSANQPLVGVVNQLNSASNKAGSYNGANPAEATSAVVFPIIQDRFFGYFTGFSIVNVGSSATPVTCTFSGTGATQSVASLAPGATFTAVQQGAIANAYNGSGTCTASAAGAKIVGILNQVNPSATTDAFFVSNGINN